MGLNICVQHVPTLAIGSVNHGSPTFILHSFRFGLPIIFTHFVPLIVHHAEALVQFSFIVPQFFVCELGSNVKVAWHGLMVLLVCEVALIVGGIGKQSTLFPAMFAAPPGGGGTKKVVVVSAGGNHSLVIAGVHRWWCQLKCCSIPSTQELGGMTFHGM